MPARPKPPTLGGSLLVFLSVGAIVVYDPFVYGDMVDNYGIVVMMQTIIAAVTYRVALISWLKIR
jgi:hypothetical protein